MSRSKLVVGILAGLLVATNLWWAYRVLDGGITLTYLRASYDPSATQLATARAVIDALVQEGASRESIIRAAKAASKDAEPYEKNGAVWVGQLGLRFSPEGRLTKVITVEQDTQ
jgi:hypothetical protein